MFNPVTYNYNQAPNAAENMHDNNIIIIMISLNIDQCFVF